MHRKQACFGSEKLSLGVHTFVHYPTSVTAASSDSETVGSAFVRLKLDLEDSKVRKSIENRFHILHSHHYDGLASSQYVSTIHVMLKMKQNIFLWCWLMFYTLCIPRTSWSRWIWVQRSFSHFCTSWKAPSSVFSLLTLQKHKCQVNCTFQEVFLICCHLEFSFGNYVLHDVRKSSYDSRIECSSIWWVSNL